jgi:hypothetical protein
MEETKPPEEAMSVKVVDVDLIEISLPDLFGLSGKTYNRLAIVLTGPAGVGKTTLAHGMLHATAEAFQGKGQGGKAGKRQGGGSSPTIQVVPLHLLLEFNRTHSVDHGGDCPLVKKVGISSSGVKTSLVTQTADAVLGRTSPRGAILLPVIAVDAATDLRGDDTDRLGNIWRGIQEFLSWLDRKFTYYIVVFIAQERANINAGPYAPRHRPGFPDSHLHVANFLIRMAPAGENNLRIVTRTVNAIADKPQAEVSLTRDTLRALISGGDSLRFGVELAGKTQVYVEA